MKGGIDSLAIFVFTYERSIHEGTFGVVGANETEEEERGRVTRDTVYRLLKTLHRFGDHHSERQRCLTMVSGHRCYSRITSVPRQSYRRNEPLTKYFPDFYDGGPPTIDSVIDSVSNPRPSITLRQLASQMSGFGVLLASCLYHFLAKRRCNLIPYFIDRRLAFRV